VVIEILKIYNNSLAHGGHISGIASAIAFERKEILRIGFRPTGRSGDESLDDDVLGVGTELGAEVALAAFWKFVEHNRIF
jgi:hypothetical protein